MKRYLCKGQTTASIFPSVPSVTIVSTLLNAFGVLSLYLELFLFSSCRCCLTADESTVIVGLSNGRLQLVSWSGQVSVLVDGICSLRFSHCLKSRRANPPQFCIVEELCCFKLCNLIRLILYACFQSVDAVLNIVCISFDECRIFFCLFIPATSCGYFFGPTKISSEG